MKAAVSATAQYLAGVLNTHVTWSLPHSRVAQDWLWSVGNSPFAYTSHGSQVSRFHVDTAHRHYVVSALDASASLVNDAVEALQAAHTKPGNLNVGRFYGSNVTSTYGRIKAIWKDVVTAVGDLDFDLATTYSTPLIALSRRFHALALEVSDVVI